MSVSLNCHVDGISFSLAAKKENNNTVADISMETSPSKLAIRVQKDILGEISYEITQNSDVGQYSGTTTSDMPLQMVLKFVTSLAGKMIQGGTQMHVDTARSDHSTFPF